MTIVRTHHFHKFPTAHYEVLLHYFFDRVIFERKSVEGIDSSRATKLLDTEPLSNFTKYFTIKVEIAIFQSKILYLLVCLLLFAEVILDTPQLACPRACRIDMCAWFKKGSKQVISDLSIYEECDKMFSSRFISIFN